MEHGDKRPRPEQVANSDDRPEKRAATRDAAPRENIDSSSTATTHSFVGDGIQHSGSGDFSAHDIFINSSIGPDLLADLHVTDPRLDKARIESTKGSLLEDSYRWVLENPEFLQWRNDPQSRLLWIKGDPGKGKTMLLCGIIDELTRTAPAACPPAYFFFQATDARLDNSTAALRGLIWLLVHQHPPLLSYLKGQYKNAGKRLFEDTNAWYALSQIFAKMLADPLLKDKILVVDALDECVADLQSFLDFVSQQSLSCCAKWIVSSRNWPSIEEILADTKQKLSLSLELNGNCISAAVHAYIQHQVDQLASKKRYTAGIRDAVQHYLTSNANDTFLWVALVCRALAESGVRKHHTLSKLTEFPLGLNALYQQMMETIFLSNDADICTEILATVSAVYRPVTVKELTALVQSLREYDDDLETLEEIIGSCGSFLTLRNGTVYFVHQSAKEFLLNKASDKILPSGIENRHYNIFLTSLEVMRTTLRRDIYNLRAPGFPIDKVTQPNPDPLAPTRYSCIYWADHLHDSGSRRAAGQQGHMESVVAVHTFLETRFLYWLEALSLLHSVPEGVMAMLKLEDSFQIAETKPLSALIRDAYRFILFHKGAIEVAPLQVYATLVFTPKRSLIKNLFRDEAPNWITVKPGMGDDWGACLQTFEGHHDGISSIAISGNGQRLASASLDGSVKIWDPDTGTCLRTLTGHSDVVYSAIFIANGQLLASASKDATVKTWDLEQGICLLTLVGHSLGIRSITFNPVNQRLASASDDKTIKIWDSARGTCLQTLMGHTELVRSLAFASDNQHLASASDDATVKIWDSTTGKCFLTIDHPDAVISVVYTEDGKRLASASLGNHIGIWDSATGACLQTISSCPGLFMPVALAVYGQHIALASGNSIRVWDLTTYTCLQTYSGLDVELTSVAFMKDGRRLVSASSNANIRMWDLEAKADLQAHEGRQSQVCSIAFSSDCQRLASGSFDSSLKIWDSITGICLQTLNAHSDAITSLKYIADTWRLVSASQDTTIKIWDTETGTCFQTLAGHRCGLTDIALTADSRRLASASHDDTVKIWDLETSECLHTLVGHSESILAIKLTADDRRLASTSADNTIKIWDIETCTCLQTLRHDFFPSSLAFTAYGELLATSDLREIKIWNLATGVCLHVLPNHGPSVRIIAFPDQTRLLTNFDVIKLDPLCDITSPVSTDLQFASSEYTISSDCTWIMKQGERLLWLPQEYRPWNPLMWAVAAGGHVAVGCSLGRVLMMQLKTSLGSLKM